MSIKTNVTKYQDLVTVIVSITSGRRISFVLANALKLYSDWCEQEYNRLSDEEKQQSLIMSIELPVAKEMYEGLIKNFNEQFPESQGNIKSDVLLK